MKLNLTVNHGGIAKPKISQVSRFWALSRSTNNGCREWLGKKDSRGYGRWQRTTNLCATYWLAHRYAWFLTNGPIPDGMFVCHRCDNPRCVNPDHLFLGTHADNMADMVRKGRQNKRNSKYQGFNHPRCTITPALVAEVLNSRARETQRQLASRLGVSQKTVWRIVQGKSEWMIPDVVKKVVKP